MNLKVVALSVCMLSGISEAAIINETNWSFSGIDANGEGSATMNIKIHDDNSLILTLNNTSPTSLENGLTGPNAPGIDGFGFNLDPNIAWSSWTLQAFNDLNQLVTLGNNTTPSPWSLAESQNNQGINIDYNPNNGNGVNEALYNPDALNSNPSGLPGGTNTNYFTTAVFTINFDAQPILAEEACGSGLDCTTFVRFQNVGLNGAGSLKLAGDLTSSSSTGGGQSSNGTGLPEPTTYSLLGLGLVAFGFAQRKRNLNS